MDFTEVQLTTDTAGHFLNTTQVFSKSDEWIVYDGRNADTQIGITSSISIVHTGSGEIKTIYQTTNQSEWGPGVGAASFSPNADTVIFIHGIRNSAQERPYTFTRRTGIGVDINQPLQPIFFDARDITDPFTNGALRGGTHAHSWSGDGQWISFTYNDYVVEQAAKRGLPVEDLRTIGIMVNGKKVTVKPDAENENNDGVMFSFLVAPVTPNPRPGSDEIKKAFDETWIGKNGYVKSDGTRQHKAIAYQGMTIDENGNEKIEVFVADIPDDILQKAQSEDLRGSGRQMPKIPQGITHRRVSASKNGISNTPRHWLRTNADGTRIAFLIKDDNNIIQLAEVSPTDEKVQPRQLTHLEFSIQGPINFSPDGKKVAFVADNSIFITDVESGASSRVTPRADEDNKPIGAVNWSNNGLLLAYNRFVKDSHGRFLQIFLLKPKN